jgi:CRP-like cAMP-binding protein
MAILKEGEVRSASVLAETDVSLAVMEINDFKKICDLYSSFKIIITTVVLKRKLENQSTINTAKEETRHLKGRKN